MSKQRSGRIPYGENSERNPLYCDLSQVTNPEELVYCKVPRSVWTIKPFNIADVSASIEGTRLDGSSLMISKDKQIKSFKRMYRKPLSVPYVYCIASYPNDMRAKYVAAIILSRAITAYRKNLVGTDFSMPEWHTLTGSYYDKFREKRNKSGSSYPSMLVLTNVDETSTPVKLEKLKDLLELYDNIPRIVVIGGTDPVTFFNQSVRARVNGALYMIPNIEKMQKNI